MKTKHLLITGAATLLCLTACATKREVPFRTSPGAPFTAQKARFDHSTYAKIPDTPTSAAYRLVLKAIPFTRKRAFWGNWSGSGCRGGLPVDAMDEIFRRHDIVYAEASSLRTMQWADDACVEALRKLNTAQMSPEAIAFCDRSAAFFSNRSLTLVGKPVSSCFRLRESIGCPFQSEEEVRQLFGLKPASQAAPPASRPQPVMLAATKTKTLRQAVAGRSKKEHRKPMAHLRNLIAGNSQP